MVHHHNTDATIRTIQARNYAPAFSLEAVATPPWMVGALCAQTDPEAWFPEKGGSTREAKAICAGCTVAAECLDYALENQERFGIWGGLSERERRKLLKAMGRPTDPEDDQDDDQPPTTEGTAA